MTTAALPGTLCCVAATLAGCAHAPPPASPAPAAVESAPVSPPAPARASSDEDDGMKVSGGLGTLSEDEVAAPFERRWDEITRCYDRASGELPYLGGRVELKLRVGKGGAVKRAWVARSTFGHYGAERCFVQVARGLTFTAPHDGAEAELSYPIELRGKRAAAAWDRAPLEPAVARHRRELAACAGGRLPASLALTLYLGPGGRVLSAGVSAAEPVDDAVGACLADKARAWRLDDPLGKVAKATVTVVP